MATPVPTTTPSANDYSMNSGWINTAGCPAEIITGIKDSMGSLGTVTQTTPSTSSGPGVLPALTSKFVPSCSYVIHYNNGLTLNGEIFIGMGPSYQTLFASGILNAGFVQKTVVGHSTNYLRQNDDAVVSLTYDPVGTDGVPYSIVSVAGTNS